MIEVLGLTLLLCLFTALVIQGVHVVTRPGFIGETLGQEVSEQKELDRMENELMADIVDSVDHLLLNFHENQHQQRESWEYIKLIKDFEAAINARQDIFEDSIDNLDRIAQKKQNSRIRKVLRPISKPLTECTTCMASFWSMVVFGTYAICPFMLAALAPFAIVGITQTVEGVKSITRINNKV